MAGRIPQSFVDELISRADIVELIGTRVPLKKAGREYRACCPFHEEKTPSFWVSPDKQFFHCFGCGAHGTALGFLMQYDQLPFPEAVEELAGRMGLEVPREGGVAPKNTQHEELFELLGRVAGYFEETLAADERARNYARGRGLDREIAARFRIGYAPDAWNEVLRRFGATPESRERLLQTGLIIPRETPRPGSEPWYDRFRDRLMFPIRDQRGRVIGFGGRVLDKGEPKYLNSPETDLFHKGRELYGLHEVRLSRVKLERLLIVEGYMDVVRLHQAGVQYAVATLGTATTPEHLRRAFKLVNELVFCFDGDRAGRAAAWRALQNALPETREGRELRFLFLPEGEDPDSLIGKEGRAAFEQRLATALPLSEYLLAHLCEQADLGSADGKAKLVALAWPLISTVPTGVYQELLLERLGSMVGMSATRLRELRGTADRVGGSASAAATAPATARNAAGYDYADMPRDARREPPRVGRGSLVTQAIQIALHFPAAAAALPPAVTAVFASVDLPGAGTLRELLDFLRAQPRAGTGVVLEHWRERPESRRLAELASGESLIADQASAERELAEILGRLSEQRSRQRLDELIDRLAAGATHEELKEYQQLIKSLGGASRSSGPAIE
jgi:DNA primase